VIVRCLRWSAWGRTAGPINGVSKNEGNNGTTSFVFTVTLSGASGASVSVNFATADSSARAPDDYEARSERSTSRRARPAGRSPST
jgi:hypothetical protein